MFFGFFGLYASTIASALSSASKGFTPSTPHRSSAARWSHRADLDNSCGHVWDALQKLGVITNDRDIVEARLKREDVSEITIQVDSI